MPSPRTGSWWLSPWLIRRWNGLKPVDYLEVAWLLLFAVFLGTAWLGFTLAEFGQDHPVAVLLVGLVALLIGSAIVFRRRWQSVGWLDVAGLAVPLALGAALFFPPDEWILGAADPGVYVSAGAIIARTGGIVFRSPELAGLDPAVSRVLVSLPVASSPPGRLPGFYLSFLTFRGLLPAGLVFSGDRVVPHAFHLYPAILAFGYAIAGIRAELLVTPLLALFGVASLYLFARRLIGTGTATIAASFLAISPAEVWFARFPAAEVLVQVLLFGGFFAFVTLLDHPNRWIAIVAGAAFGEAHLAKIETLPFPFLIGAFLIFQAAAWRADRRWWWLVAVYLVLLVQSAAHAAIIAGLYSVSTLQGFVSPRLAVAAVGLTIVGLVALAGVAALPSVHKRVSRCLGDPRLARAARTALPVAIGLVALYAYYIRPLPTVALMAAVPSDPGAIPTINNLQSFVRLGWYVGPLGLLLGTLGWMLLARERLDRRSALFYLFVLCDALIFLGDARANPVHYWSARRWLPLIIPGFCLAAAYLIRRSIPTLRDHWSQAVLPAGCAVIMVLQLLGGTRPLVGYVEYRGAIGQFASFAARFPANSVLLFSDGEPGRRYTTPLQFLFGRTSFVVPRDASVEAAAREAARSWMSEGRSVYWVTSTSGPDPFEGPGELGLRGTEVMRQRISLPEKLVVWDRKPGGDGLFQQDLEVWQLQPD